MSCLHLCMYMWWTPLKYMAHFSSLTVGMVFVFVNIWVLFLFVTGKGVFVFLYLPFDKYVCICNYTCANIWPLLIIDSGEVAAAWWPLLWIQDVSSDKAATDHWCIGGAWVSCFLIGRHKPSCFLIGWWTGHGPLMYRRTIITESLNAAALCKTRSFHFQRIPVWWRQNVLKGGVRVVKILQNMLKGAIWFYFRVCSNQR